MHKKMVNGIFRSFFSPKGNIDLGSFIALIIVAFFVLEDLFFNFYQTVLIVLPSKTFLLSVISYALPLLYLYIIFCIFFKRINGCKNKRCFGLFLLLGLVLFLSYFSMTGWFYGLGIKSDVSTVTLLLRLIVPFAIPVGFGILFMGACFSKIEPEVHVSVKSVALTGLAIYLVNFFMGFQAVRPFSYPAHFRLVALAEEGHETAKRRVADAYATGIGVKRDLKEAIRWYGEIYNSGDTDSALYIAIAYNELKEDELAQEWYRKAAERGSDKASHVIDNIFKSPPDAWSQHSLSVCDRKSIKFDLQACRQLAISGNTKAQLGYADILTGLSKEEFNAFSNAVFWYEQAAQGGNLTAQDKVAKIFQNGLYERIDINKALYWYSSLGSHQYIFWYLPRKAFLSLLKQEKCLKNGN